MPTLLLEVSSSLTHSTPARAGYRAHLTEQDIVTQNA
jgi:hypothetical protein